MAEDRFRIWIVASHYGDSPPGVLGVLDDTEREQAARFVRSADRSTYLTAHAALRYLLAAIIEVPPGEIKFTRSSSGKPTLSTFHRAGSINLSISHTTGYSAIAISHRGAIGVDIERRRHVSDYLHITSRVFGSAVAKQLSSFGEMEQDALFLQMWTAGEAYVKASGLGLAGSDRHLPVSLGTDGIPLLHHDSTARPSWALRTMMPSAEYVGSVVTEGDDVAPNLRCFVETTTLSSLCFAQSG